ncbi:MAG TPA: hypothetical protein VNR18_13475 [Hyphomicrobiales bacterium]|nr:hypothetical protein [Hyphomicrobiales bacterium]
MALVPDRVRKYTAKLGIAIYKYAMPLWHEAVDAAIDAFDDIVGAVRDEVTNARGGHATLLAREMAQDNALQLAATDLQGKITTEAATRSGADTALNTRVAVLEAGHPGHDAFVLNPRNVTGQLTVPAGHNASSVGPIEIAEGAEINIDDNATWSIV